MTPSDLDRISTRLRASRAAFAAARPFPHLVLDDLLPASLATALASEAEAPDIPWQSLHHVNERKLVFGDLRTMRPVAASVVHDLHSLPIRQALSSMTGISDLIPDPHLDGAGLHRMLPGGHLNVHVDALSHAKQRTWSRQINLILFLNHDWQEDYRGWLELWDDKVETCVRRISPVFNRAVLFQTTERSFHGVSAGIACPPGRARKSLALYYFRDEAHPVRLRTTRYVPLPHDPTLRRALIRIDRGLVALYSLLKRYTPLDNARITRLLRRF